MYLQEDGPSLATVLPTGLLAVGGVEDLMSRDAAVGHTLLAAQHPDDHVRHAVLGLQTRRMLAEKTLAILGVFETIPERQPEPSLKPLGFLCVCVCVPRRPAG